MSVLTPEDVQDRLKDAAVVDAAVLQDIIDEEEAWLEGEIGPLDGERIETFLLASYPSRPHELYLKRRTDAIEISDNGTVYADADVQLRGNGRIVARRLGLGAFLGPEVAVTYTPNDSLIVRSVLYSLIGLAIGEYDNSAGYSSELMGSYQYQLANGAGTKTRKRLLRKILGASRPTTMRIRSSLVGRPIYPAH